MTPIRTLIFLLALGALGCEVSPYCLTCKDAAVDPNGDMDGAVRDDAARPDAAIFVEVDGGDANTAPDGCTLGAVELCNQFDDDCDGMTDEGIDLQTSVANCGACGQACEPDNAFGKCVAGECTIDMCAFGARDLDGVPGNGCEYACAPSALNCTDPVDGECCDRRDNDCDGMVDERFSLDSDPNHCGACQRQCVEANATSTCVSGMCQLGSCNAGYFDRDQSASNGCEYACTPASPPTETCNGRDDDCDGTVDEGNPEGGASCGNSTGLCMAGTQQCRQGVLTCVGQTLPALDVCNAMDDDCDGSVDENYMLQTDSRNCGMCGRTCSFANSISQCTNGSCSILVCQPGFINRDGLLDNGCEFACDFQGAEVCNGRDDDCNGQVDDGLTAPATFCQANGVCAGVTARCSGSQGWTCGYPAATYQAEETRCDSLDNDCDGRVDEAFPLVGTQCSNGGRGICAGPPGNYRYACNAAGNGVVCNAPAIGNPEAFESCDGEDDDCDGRIDEMAQTNWVRLGTASVWMMQYEASRPDARASTAGTSAAMACSEPNRLPWTLVTRSQAEAACNAIGARLCTASEWATGCRSQSGTCQYATANSCSAITAANAANYCNINEYDTTSGGADDDAVLATRSRPSCYAEWGANDIYDLSGNLREWTGTMSGTGYAIRGGSTTDPYGGSACGFDFVAAANSVALPNLGFRCCRSTAP